MKIAVISVYFGKWVPYHKLWLKSCEYNPEIDFYVIGDQRMNDLPANVHTIIISLDEIRSMASKKLGVEISLKTPYKLCDYRPMYGLIFEDYLRGYDYWGHCDMDMIFGNISQFLRKYELEKYDKFLDLGHLSLYRNTPENNSRFKLSGGKYTWEQVVTEDRNHWFDEWVGIDQKFKDHNIPLFDRRIFSDIAEIYKRFKNAYNDPQNYKYQLFYWHEGGTYYQYWNGNKLEKLEVIYIHFKRRGFGKENFDSSDVRTFVIGPDGFTKWETDNFTLEDVKRLNPYRSVFFEKFEFYRFKGGRAINKIKRIIGIA